MECVVFGPLGVAVIVGCVLGGGGPVGSNGLLPVAQRCVALYKMLIHKCGGCLTARYCSRVIRGSTGMPVPVHALKQQ
jgi:hypothetical protein